MALSMDTEFMGGDFLAPGSLPRLYDSGPKLAQGLRAYSLVRMAAAEVGCDWQLEPISDLCGISQQSLGLQDRTWRALEPTVIGNRVKWTCTVASPKSSDMSSLQHCPSDDTVELRGSGVDNISADSLTSTLTPDTDPDNVNVVMSDLDAFPSSVLHDVGSLLDDPGPLGTDGYSEFELLSGQFPMISPDFEANEDSNSCGSGASENQWSAGAANLSAVDEILPGCIFQPVLDNLQQEEREMGLSPMLFPEQMHHLPGLQISESSLLVGTEDDPGQSGDLYKEERGVELVQQLLACSQAISGGDVGAAQQHVERLGHLISSTGNSMERVATYFTEALTAWLGGKKQCDFGGNLNGYMDLSSSAQTWIAYQVFYASCPYLIVTHFTANQAIFEAFEGEEKVHIVDLDVKQGLQWPSLIQALSQRPGGPPQLRITGVAGAAPDLPSMMATRNRLLDFADMFNVPLEFTILTENVENLQPWMLGIRENEALAVNCVSSLHQLVHHPKRSLYNFLQMIYSLEPSLVTVVEEDANHDQDFLPRFMDALHYYSSMFDSLAASLSSSLVEREMVERLVLGKDIVNIVGKEGEERFARHQTAEQWTRHLSEVGFQLYPPSPHSILQAKLLLSMYPVSKFCLVNEEGYLSLGWQDNPLYSVSCWVADTDEIKFSESF